MICGRPMSWCKATLLFVGFMCFSQLLISVDDRGQCTSTTLRSEWEGYSRVAAGKWKPVGTGLWLKGIIFLSADKNV